MKCPRLLSVLTNFQNFTDILVMKLTVRATFAILLRACDFKLGGFLSTFSYPQSCKEDIKRTLPMKFKEVLPGR